VPCRGRTVTLGGEAGAAGGVPRRLLDLILCDNASNVVVGVLLASASGCWNGSLTAKPNACAPPVISALRRSKPRGSGRGRPVASADVSEPSDERLDQFIIFAGFGEVMHRFQVLEMSLWGLLAHGIKPATQEHQVLAKLEQWNATTFGKLMRGMKNQGHWPPDLLDKLLHSVDVRNYLAHHFLREYFIAERSEANRDNAAQELANLANWLDDLSDELDAHLASQGIASVDDLDEETAADIDAMRPKDWFYFMDNDSAGDGQQPSQP